ncbi:MAG: ABC transporter permease, partial [Nitrososphaerales archaeon]
LNVYSRDLQHIWPILLQVAFFLMPIIYRPTILPEDFQSLISIIPMSRIIDMAHNLALYNILPPVTDWIYVTATSFAILALGYFAFRKLEERISEEL